MPPKPQQATEDALSAVTDKLDSLQLHLDKHQSALLEKMEQQTTSLQSLATSIASLAKSISQQPPPPTTSDHPPPSSTVLQSHPIGSSPPPAHCGSSSKSHHYTSSPFSLKPPKLHMPSFDGTGVLNWIFQADQYFNFYKIPADDRLAMIGFYMVGDALSWFKWMYTNHQLTTWDSFVRTLELTFGPSTLENPQGALFKLRQLGSIHDYNLAFAKLCNRVMGLPPNSILQCFISGLKLAIQKEIIIHSPYNLTQAIALAKLIEEKLKDNRPSYTTSPSRCASTPNPPILPTPPTAPFPIRRLSPV